MALPSCGRLLAVFSMRWMTRSVTADIAPTPSAMQVGIALPRPRTHGVNAVAAEHAAAGEQPAVLPVRQPQLRPTQCVLAVHPAGESIAGERRVERLVEALLPLGVG